MALIAFVGLLLVDIGDGLRSFLSLFVLELGGLSRLLILQSIADGTCRVLDAVALVFLIVAFWQAMVGNRPAEA